MAGQPRLKFVDGLRGIAACMVMLYHLGNRTGLEPITRWGYLGVGIFFVISGFVIASTLLDRRIGGVTIGRFFGRRFVRLDIPYWANIAVTVLLGAVLYRVGGQMHHYTEEQIASHLVYLQNILGIQPINQVYWTLCLEIQFYLALSLILWAAQGLRLSAVTFQVAIITSIALSIICNAGFLHSPRGLMFPFWWAFGLGAMVCWWRAGQIGNAALAVTFVVIAVLPFVPMEAWRITGFLTAAAIAITLSLGREGTWLSGAAWQFLGRTSYSLYLYHGLIGWEAQTFAQRFTGPYEALAFGILVSIIVAWIAYVLIERPAIQLSHRIKLAREEGRSFAPLPET